MTEIIAPWGPPINERPRIPSQDELLAASLTKKVAKLERRVQRIENGESKEGIGVKNSRPGGVKALMSVAK